jgi:hypothetical protein
MKTRSITLSLVTLVLLIALVQSCKHEPLPIFPGNPGGGGGTGGGGTTPPSTGICFKSQVLPLYQSNCAMAGLGCHDANSAAEGYVLDNYANITKRGISPGNPNKSKLYTILSNGMPPRGYTALTAEQKGIIAQWITEGAKNTTNCNTGCDTTKFTYKADILPLMQTYCTGCHGGTSPSKGIDLSSYTPTAAIAKDRNRLYGSVAHLNGYVAMPQGAAQLPACELRIIQKWVDAGAPNN